MMVPVRCFTCGKVVSEYYDEFKERAIEGDEDPAEVLDDLGIERYCCRRMMVSHKDLVDVVSPYQ
ncbi:MAG: DNA-directed RNA polymerase subunit N [Halobacteria archaeon]|nr:DNA-directed RNA polymerase subunit N [Halobacteria archaeon]